MSEEKEQPLRACPFCGNVPYYDPDTRSLVVHRCGEDCSTFFVRKWNSAHAWKELDAAKAEIERLKVDVMHWQQAFAETSEDRDRADSDNVRLRAVVERLRDGCFEMRNTFQRWADEDIHGSKFNHQSLVAHIERLLAESADISINMSANKTDDMKGRAKRDATDVYSDWSVEQVIQALQKAK